MSAAGQASGKVKLLGKSLQQKFEKLSAQRVKAQLRACVEQLCRKVAEGFPLEPTIVVEK